MNSAPRADLRTVPAHDLRMTCSRIACGLALLLVAATFFLISPPQDQTYPGAIPWRPGSWLRPLIDLMALGGLVATVHGVEIKVLSFHIATVLGLLLLGIGTWAAPPRLAETRAARTARHAQLLLGGWVALSLLSATWSGMPDFARGQAALYGLSVAWALVLAHTVDARHLRPFLVGLTAISAACAGLAIWYFNERNPHHRASFPIGNPTVLAPVILPAILATGTVLVGAAWQSVRGHFRPNWPWLLGAAVALPLLLWCLVLTRSRGALLALAAGGAGIAVLLVRRRVRWLLAGASALGLGAAGAALFYAFSLDVTMARGATMRFRIYAWRYAVEFWQARPLTGNGAGCYPRLAGQLAGNDRFLDPAAFMAEIVEHAHNELFEVLSEIGLVGGVTYVGGLLATFLAGSAIVQAAPRGPERWLRLGLVGGFTALVADSMFGVAPRLPGGPAVYFTLLGWLWGVARTGEQCLPDGLSSARLARSGPGWRRVLPLVACVAAAGGAGWLTVRGWTGVMHEYRAARHYEAGRYAAALSEAQAAEPRLLDPVRKVAALRLAVQCRTRLAAAAFESWWHSPASAAVGVTRTEAVAAARAAHDEALRLTQQVPALTNMDAAAARLAEWLELLLRETDPGEARVWNQRAEMAWRRQRERTPYDVETLLALSSRYRASLAGHLGLLRDALRFRDAERTEDAARLRSLWLVTLERLSQAQGFERTLQDFLAAVAPITPQTDLDAIVASMAPEVHRLAAAWYALRGDYLAAATASGRAAELYEPMRARFPELYPLALAEQARYLLQAAPAAAPAATVLTKQAIDALPVIQEQKYEELTFPYRRQLALCLLASGEADKALAVWREALGARANDAALVEEGLRRLLAEAAEAGVAEETLGRVTTRLRQELPGLGQADDETHEETP